MHPSSASRDGSAPQFTHRSLARVPISFCGRPAVSSGVVNLRLLLGGTGEYHLVERITRSETHTARGIAATAARRTDDKSDNVYCKGGNDHTDGDANRGHMYQMCRHEDVPVGCYHVHKGGDYWVVHASVWQQQHRLHVQAEEKACEKQHQQHKDTDAAINTGDAKEDDVVVAATNTLAPVSNTPIVTGESATRQSPAEQSHRSRKRDKKQRERPDTHRTSSDGTATANHVTDKDGIAHDASRAHEQPSESVPPVTEKISYGKSGRAADCNSTSTTSTHHQRVDGIHVDEDRKTHDPDRSDAATKSAQKALRRQARQEHRRLRQERRALRHEKRKQRRLAKEMRHGAGDKSRAHRHRHRASDGTHHHRHRGDAKDEDRSCEREHSPGSSLASVSHPARSLSQPESTRLSIVSSSHDAVPPRQTNRSRAGTATDAAILLTTDRSHPHHRQSDPPPHSSDVISGRDTLEPRLSHLSIDSQEDRDGQASAQQQLARGSEIVSPDITPTLTRSRRRHEPPPHETDAVMLAGGRHGTFHATSTPARRKRSRARSDATQQGSQSGHMSRASHDVAHPPVTPSTPIAGARTKSRDGARSAPQGGAEVRSHRTRHSTNDEQSRAASSKDASAAGQLGRVSVVARASAIVEGDRPHEQQQPEQQRRRDARLGDAVEEWTAARETTSRCSLSQTGGRDDERAEAVGEVYDGPRRSSSHCATPPVESMSSSPQPTFALVTADNVTLSATHSANAAAAAAAAAQVASQRTTAMGGAHAAGIREQGGTRVGECTNHNETQNRTNSYIDEWNEVEYEEQDGKPRASHAQRSCGDDKNEEEEEEQDRHSSHPRSPSATPSASVSSSRVSRVRVAEQRQPLSAALAQARPSDSSVLPSPSLPQESPALVFTPIYNSLTEEFSLDPSMANSSSNSADYLYD